MGGQRDLPSRLFGHPPQRRRQPARALLQHNHRRRRPSQGQVGPALGSPRERQDFPARRMDPRRHRDHRKPGHVQRRQHHPAAQGQRGNGARTRGGVQRLGVDSRPHHVQPPAGGRRPEGRDDQRRGKLHPEPLRPQGRRDDQQRGADLQRRRPPPDRRPGRRDHHGPHALRHRRPAKGQRHIRVVHPPDPPPDHRRPGRYLDLHRHLPGRGEYRAHRQVRPARQGRGRFRHKHQNRLLRQLARRPLRQRLRHRHPGV